MSLVLAIDLGTGSCRAALYNRTLQRISGSTVEYATRYERDRAEQDPEQIYQGVLTAVRETINRSKVECSEILSVTFDCSVHTLVGLDGNKAPVTPVLTWEDSRARNLVAQWKRQNLGDNLYQLTGCPLHPMYSPAKIAWWRLNAPDLFRKISFFVTVKAFVIYRFTGELFEDQATASGNGLMNIHKLDWEEAALRLAGINLSQLPVLVPPTYVIKKIRPDIQAALGLASHTQLMLGSSDAAMSSLGSGTIRPDQMTLMIGTSGAVRRLTDRPILDPLRRTFCYYFGNQIWFAGGAINNGGLVMRWFRDNFGQQAFAEAERKKIPVYSVLSDYASRVGPGAAGLMFLPFLAGERAPNWNGNMRGIYFGVALHHGQPAFIRAIMEGVSYRMKSISQPLSNLMGQPKEIRVTGGFSRSALWLRILADIIGNELSVTGEPEGSVLGTAAFAFQAIGELESFQKLEEMNSVRQIVEPDLDTHRFYETEYQKFVRIYLKLKDEFTA